MRKTVLAVLVLVLAALPTLAQGDVEILHFNDTDEIEAIDDGARGGAARAATLIERHDARDPLLLFSGDALSPSLLSAVLRGSQMIDVFERLGVDAAVLGNHEFDFGPAVTVERIAESAFPWLATNLLDRNDGEPLAGALASVSFDRAGVRIAVLGFVGDWGDLNELGDDAQWVDYVERGRDAVATLEAEGAEVVVALTHMSLHEDERLAREVPGIDLILGGHDHGPISTVVNDTLIWKTGANLRNLGALDVYVLNAADPLVLPTSVRIDASVPEDPEIAAVVGEYAAQLDEALDEPVGETTTPLDATRATVRHSESNYGNLIADAMRDATDADVAIANGGGIRTDRIYEAGTLTRRDVQSVLPFGNVIVSLRISGETLRGVLENAVSQVEEGAGRFPHVSGMTLHYDPSRPPGERVLDVTVGGEPLDPQAEYTLAVNDYNAGGGDGFTMLRDAERVIDESGGRDDASVVMTYIERNAPVSPEVEGRVTTP